MNTRVDKINCRSPAQSTIRDGRRSKDSANPFFKSSYADLTSVIKAIKSHSQLMDFLTLNSLLAMKHQLV